MTVSDARGRLGLVIDEARDAPVYLTRHNRPVAVLVDAAEFERLRELAEDAEDAAVAARREMQETGEAAVPWDEVKAELGLV